MIIYRLFIDRSVADVEEVQTFIQKIKHPPEFVDDPADIYRYILSSQDPVTEGKRNIFLTRNKGSFVKKCPGTTEYTCCDYKILHIGTFCYMDCSYCILQAYFHPPVLQYFMNFDDMDRELEDLFKQNEISRVGTGEFTDSLIWEPWVDRTVCLVKKFSQQRKAVLELKTKTISVDKLIGLDHNRKTILAWSLNTERIIASDEKYTTPLEKRIKTAQECAALGYPVAFHFDPIVIYEGCQDEYRSVVSRLLASVPASSIAYISLGTFRYIPSLKKIIESRFPESRIVYGEFIPGLDGKMRYFKPLRLRIYKEIYNTIMSLAPDVFVYYCMEDSEIWDKTMGFIPEEKGGLGRMLDRRVAEICGLDI